MRKVKLPGRAATASVPTLVTTLVPTSVTSSVTTSVAASLTLAVAALLVSSAALAAVDVTFVKADQFTDVPFSPSERARVIKELGQHFQQLARQLPPDQNLTIDVLDVDLAGRLEPSRRRADDIRMMRGGADWPRIKLRYTLVSGGKVMGSGEADLSNMNYLNRINHYSSGDELRYEKQMIDDWFKQQFAGTPAPQ